MSHTLSITRIVSVLGVLLMLAAFAAFNSGRADANPPAREVAWAHGELYNAIVPMGPDGPIVFSHVPDGTVPAVADLKTTDDLYVVTTNSVTPLVSDSAPGDPDYNGGRWLPRMVTPIGAGPAGELTSEAEIMAAALAGLVSISAAGDVFECPLTSEVH